VNVQTPSPTATTTQPSSSPSIITPPAPDSYQTIGAVLGIAFAVIAAILGYRILRGGRGL
jgi:hypothetical protein